MSESRNKPPHGSIAWAAGRIRRMTERERTLNRLEEEELERLRASGWHPNVPAPALPAGGPLGLADAAKAIAAQFAQGEACRAEARRRVAARQQGAGEPGAQAGAKTAKPGISTGTWANTRPPLSRIAVRGPDGYGSGAYGASRDGGRPHVGVDLVAAPGTPVYAPISGRFEVGDPYGHDPARRGRVQSVRVVAGNDRLVRMFYVQPDPRLRPGHRVEAGTFLGKSQSLQALYPPKANGSVMTDHVHVQIEDSGGTLDATPVVDEWRRRAMRKTEQRSRQLDRIEGRGGHKP